MGRIGKCCLAIVALGFIAGCGSNAPPTLIQARTAMHQASGGELEHAAPRAMDEARRAVGEAERVLQNAGDQRIVEDLSYVALRRIEEAKVEARIAQESTATPAAPRGGGPASN